MVKPKGPLGFTRLTSLGPLVDEQSDMAQVGQQAQLGREEFIRRCEESESAEKFAKNFAAAFVGEEGAEEIPIESLDNAEKSFCEGLADFFGLE